MGTTQFIKHLGTRHTAEIEQNTAKHNQFNYCTPCVNWFKYPARHFPIDLCHDEPIPEKPGYVRELPRKTAEILAELNARLDAEGLRPEEYGFSLSASREIENGTMWPLKYAWVACYAVTGGSEGHYIHIDVITRDDKRILMSLGKTFEGMERALEIANACSIHLGA